MINMDHRAFLLKFWISFCTGIPVPWFTRKKNKLNQEKDNGFKVHIVLSSGVLKTYENVPHVAPQELILGELGEDENLAR